MADLIQLDGFRCTNHMVDKTKLAAAQFDIHNPCSWCRNLELKRGAAPAFYYREFGRWEFPFVAETTCKNFSLLALSRSARGSVDRAALVAAQEVVASRNRILTLKGKLSPDNWTAFNPREVATFLGEPVVAGTVRYPGGMPDVQFVREANALHADCYELAAHLRNSTAAFRKEVGIRDSRMETWLATVSKQMADLKGDIQAVEEARDTSPLHVLSNWGFNTVAGGLAWDGVKEAARVIAEIFRR